MYKIIGADGKEYGPIRAEQLRQWISEGRVNAQTRIKRDGAADWQLLGSLPEFISAHAALTAPSPKTSALAITSLVLGVLGLCGITALVGLIFGIVSLVKIKNSQGRLSGGGLAIAGICVSAFMLLMGIPFMLGLLLPAFAKAKERAESIRCVNNMKQLEIGVISYAGSPTNRFPPASSWCTAIGGGPGGGSQAFLCPKGDKTKQCHFAFNSNLDGADRSKVNPMTVMIFETDGGGWNLSGGPELMISKPRHGQTVTVGFVDGHIEGVNTNRLKQLWWQP